MTPAQQSQIAAAGQRANVLECNGHDRESIEFTLRQDGYAEAVVQAVLESVWFHI